MLSEREVHAQHYWRVMQEGISRDTAADFRDELDRLSEFTGSSVLRDLCARNRRRFDGIINVQCVANGQ